MAIDGCGLGYGRGDHPVLIWLVVVCDDSDDGLSPVVILFLTDGDSVLHLVLDGPVSVGIVSAVGSVVGYG